ncbi:hypothetical protein JXL21_08955 [Candidatus Bathyarchaeota archaeon]|nr:hypothetical protein [Candidatus Bathyarchaeota archaeon]
MKIKLVTILVLASLLASSATVLQTYAEPDYDLLIIAPNLFVDELTPLKEWKDATGRPSIVVSLESIYADPAYSGADTAEEIKKCIADYEATHNVKYVLLVGDVDKLPMRYFYVKRAVTDEVRWLQYYLTDHYYADLYDGGGAFCSWDADGDDVYGEMIDDDDDDDYTNTDGIDFDFDVIVGRIPADSEAEVTRYVDKVIKYEKEVLYESWFKNILLVTGTGDWVYPSLPTTWDEDQNDAIATEMTTAGFTDIKLYHSNTVGDPDYPNPTNINDYLNAGAGFINVISHGNQFSWGVYDVRTDMAGLTNQDKLTVVYSFGCSTAKLGPIAASDPYIDVGGTLRDYGAVYESSYYPHPMSTWVEPAVPDPLQDSTTDIDCMPEYWNFNSDKGAVAFIGSTAEASGAMGSPVMQYFFESFASDGHRVLGDVWDSVCDKVLIHYAPESDWDQGRRWLFINVFGDPTLVLGGLADKPPQTGLTVGAPKHLSGDDTYVTSSTSFSLYANDDSAVASTHYRYYIEGLSGLGFTSGLGPFNIYATDGTINIEYYSVDDSGNQEYPVNSRQVKLDNTAPTTTLTIGEPQHLDKYVKSNTNLALSASDGSGSGVEETYYKIDDGPYNTYSTFFRVSGEGTHTVTYHSVDNLGNAEAEKTKTLILDETPPTTTITIGSPSYGDYISSDTLITMSAVDDGSDVEYTEYRLDGGPWTPYAPFHVTGDDGDHLIEYRSVDNLGNREETQSEAVTLDNTPPETSMSVGDPKHIDPPDVYVTSGTPLTLSASDGAGSGVAGTWYSVDGGLYVPYTGAFSLAGEGTHTVSFYSVDNLGAIETPLTDTVIVDDTPPEVDVVQPDGGGYVYGVVEIEITASDAGSGVDRVEYSLDDGATWLPASYDTGQGSWVGAWDTTLSSEGSHTVLARAEDYVENVGYDEAPPTFTVVYLSTETGFSHSKGKTVTDFCVVFKGQKNGYKVSTNAGSIFENITVTNTGSTVTLPNVILDIKVPIEEDFLGAGEEAFETMGARAVKIYLNGKSVTPQGNWLPDLGYVDTMQPLGPGDSIQLLIHYEYSFRGETYSDPEVSAWLGEDYVFETGILSAVGPNWCGCLSAYPRIN